MRELFTRMALKVVIGNTDDHMLNHGVAAGMQPAGFILPHRIDGRCSGTSMESRNLPINDM